MGSTRRLTLAIGFTQTLAWATTYYIPATMVGAASADLGASRTLLLGGFSLALLVCGLSSPWVGRRIERLGGRGVIATSAVVNAAGLALLASSPSVTIWYIAWAITGFGMAMGLYDAAFGTLGRLLGNHARPAIVGVTLMAGVASTLGWPSGAWLVVHVGWRASVAAYAVMQLLVILPITLIYVPKAPEHVPTTGPVDSSAPPPPNSTFLWLASFFTLRAAVSSIVSVHALVLLQGMGFSLETAVAAATLIGPAQVGSRVLDWYFGREMNPMIAAWVGAAMLPLCVLALVLGGPAVAFTVLYGLSNGILTISRGTLPLHVFGPAGYATRLGRLALPSMLISAVTPTLVSPLIAAWPASWVAAVMGAVSIVAMGCLLGLRRR